MSSKIARKHWIRDLETSESFYFHAMYESDSGYDITKSANWYSTGILGRSSPLQGYQDSSPATWTLDIPIFSSMEQDDGRTVEDVDRAIKFFLSMPYPDYDGGVKPPHKYLIVPGAQLMPFTVIPQTVSVNPLGPWDENGMSHRARVRATFYEVDDIPKSYRDVRG